MDFCSKQINQRLKFILKLNYLYSIVIHVTRRNKGTRNLYKYLSYTAVNNSKPMKRA